MPPTSLSWPTTALRCSPPPREASQARNTSTDRSSASISSDPMGAASYRSKPAGSACSGSSILGASAASTGSECSQSCMGPVMVDPAASAAPALTKPRRLSMRSIPVNSVRTAAVRSGAHGSPSGLSCVPASCRFPIRPRRPNPRSSMVTTRPSRSVNRAASTLGTGSRGTPPCRSSASPARCRWPVAGGPWPPPACSPFSQVRPWTSRRGRTGRTGGCWVLRSRQAPRFSAVLTVTPCQRPCDNSPGFARVRQLVCHPPAGVR